MNILITGGNGYLGKSLYEKLKNYYNILSISRNDFDLRNTEQTINFFNDKFFDVVIHCAINGAKNTKEENYQLMDDNLQMFYNLLCCNKNYAKFINIGSGAELYLTDLPYGLSKKVIAKSIFKKSNFYNLRIFAVFDENEADTRLIKSNLIRYIKNQNLYLYNNKKMDFFYMEDLIKVVKYYIENKNLPKEYNLVYEEKIEIADILNIINNLSDKKMEIISEGLKDFQYIGEYQSLGLDFIGLKQGIKNVYNILLNDNIYK